MAYFHGVKAQEVSTSVVAPVSTTAGLPVVFGTAPVHLTADPSANVNKPVICYTWNEAVKHFGYSADWDKYTLCEAMYSEFKLYAVQPIVFVNVLDPKKHKESVSATEKTVPTDKVVNIADSVLLDTLQVKATADGEAATLNKDYTAAYNDDGELVVTIIKTGALADAEKVFVAYDKVDASKVTADDIIGGASTEGTTKGLELIDTIYTSLSMVPGIIAAPGWSENPTVASVMKAKALNIDGLFRCIVLTDVDTAAAKYYADVNEWKNKNNYTGVNQIVCWPCVKNGDAQYHMSTHIMGILGVVDAANDDVPYQSPSNQSMQATGLCLKDGTEVARRELNASNNWQYTFENLDEYKDGKKISYTLTEDAVSGFKATITCADGKGFTVTNTKTTPKTPDKNTPTPGTKAAGGPKTGDTSHIGLWLILMLAALSGLVGNVIYMRKRR